MQEAKTQLSEREKEVNDLKGHLAQNRNNLTSMEIELEQAKKLLEKERHNHDSQESLWKERCQILQREVDRLRSEMQHKQDCISTMETHLKQVIVFTKKILSNVFI